MLRRFLSANPLVEEKRRVQRAGTMFPGRRAGVLCASVAVAGGVAYLIWHVASSSAEKEPEPRPRGGGDGVSAEEQQTPPEPGAEVAAEAQKVSSPAAEPQVATTDAYSVS